jgi:hypothetical protein
VERYEELYAGRAYLPAAVAKPVKDEVQAAVLAAPLRARPRVRARASPARETEQLALAL